MLQHAADSTKRGYKRILVRTVDTDVVLAVSTANKLRTGEQFIVSFGTGKTFRYLDATHIARKLGNDKLSVTYYLLFKHSPGKTIRRQVLQEEEGVQHGQCGVSSRMIMIRRSTYTCPNTKSSTHR